MNCKKICGKVISNPALLIRLVVGFAFVTYGFNKLSGIEGGMAFFSSLGLPGFLFIIVAVVELLSGVAILINKFVKYAGYSIAVIMLGAIFLVKIKSGYIGGYEIDLAYLSMALFLAINASNSKKEDCEDCEGNTCSVEDHDHSKHSHDSEEA